MHKAAVDRYEKMPYPHLGRSGLRFSKIAFGMWHNFGADHDFENMRQMIFAAFDNGITVFDLANNYGPPEGEAERNFGKILREDLWAYRDELLICTKAGYTMWPGPYGDFGSRKYLLASLDQSLERLGIPYVDVFYHHRMDPDTPLEESMGALEQAVRSGKALYAGLSNYDGPTLERASQILEERRVPFVVNQNRFNILDRTIERNGLLAKTQELEKGLIVFSPLAQGLLTNRYLDGIPEDSRIRTDGRFLKENALTPERVAILRKLNEIAKKRGESLADMALSWILRHPGVTSVLIGASKVSQILDNCRCLESAPFSEEDLEAIDTLAKAF